jgi:glycosyltransferase involved in cell wall biosynthesis
MRVLMLGWEFPPYIAGGLGVACHGLASALDALGHEVVFVLPKSVPQAPIGSHGQVISPLVLRDRLMSTPPAAAGGSGAGSGQRVETRQVPGLAGERVVIESGPAGSRVVIREVPATFSSTYGNFTASLPHGMTEATLAELRIRAERGDVAAGELVRSITAQEIASIGTIGSAEHQYSGDLFGDAERYARLVVALARTERFDVVHAHDWLAFPAGLAVSRATGKPLVAHIHATEFDRSGAAVNQNVYDIERAGMHGASRVVAVSMLTRSIIEARYGVSRDKIDVVWNGVEQPATQPTEASRIAESDKIVLFLGRITMQKGPEYFIAAAKRVLEKIDNVKFVVAGSGDMAMRMIELAAAMGIGHKVLFTGFLRGKDVERIFKMADCYVMPSVSEPFGIAALEALHAGTPIIVSKQSGVAEAVTHALKVDFWDIDEMANKIVAVLKYAPLGKTLTEHGAFEVRKLTWEGAAEKCVDVYHRAMREA